MKVALLHNPKAGSGKPAAKELTALLSSAGHEVRYQSTKKKGIKGALKRDADLVVVAGGDGTVRKVFRQMDTMGISSPALILPMGTMNNVASCVGVSGSLEKLVAAISCGVPTPFHYHRISAGIFEEAFFESAGVGVWASYLCFAEDHREEVDAMSGGRSGAERDFAALATFARNALPVELEITAEGQKLRDSYLIAEIMNIPTIGARMRWGTEDSLRGDHVQIALVEAGSRRALIEYFAVKADGGEATFPGIHCNFAGPVEIDGEVRECHVDDKGFTLASKGRLRVVVRRSPVAIPIYLPQ